MSVEELNVRPVRRMIVLWENKIKVLYAPEYENHPRLLGSAQARIAMEM